MASQGNGPFGQPIYAENATCADASDLTQIAQYAATVGFPPITTLAALNLIAGTLGQHATVTADGLDTMAVYASTGTAWKRQTPARGVATFTTDASGLGTIVHNLGAVPSTVQLAQAFTDDVNNKSNITKPMIGALTATTIQVVVARTDTNARLLNTAVMIHWVAWP